MVAAIRRLVYAVFGVPLQAIGRRILRHRAKVSLRAKCPACGFAVKHPVWWNATGAAIVHQCAVCNAVWAESPVVEAASWNFMASLEEEEARRKPSRPFGSSS